jgi:hypothetical protein
MQGVPLLVRIIDLACTNVGNTGFIAASPNRPTSGNARSDPPRTKIPLKSGVYLDTV